MTVDDRAGCIADLVDDALFEVRALSFALTPHAVQPLRELLQKIRVLALGVER